MSETARPPFPPFDFASASAKVRMAENAWNGRNPEAVAQAYTVDSVWRNRSQFLYGRAQIIQFLQGKWASELDYKLIKQLWAWQDNRIAVRFAYEWHNQQGQWFRSYGNENWQFADNGLMQQRHASINDLPINPEQRLLTWQGDLRPDDFPSLSDLGL